MEIFIEDAVHDRLKGIVISTIHVRSQYTHHVNIHLSPNATLSIQCSRQHFFSISLPLFESIPHSAPSLSPSFSLFMQGPFTFFAKKRACFQKQLVFFEKQGSQPRTKRALSYHLIEVLILDVRFFPSSTGILPLWRSTF